MGQNELELELRQAIKLSGQSSYERSAPDRNAIAALETVRSRLLSLTEEQPDNPRAWDLLSKAEECLLNYVGAIRCVEKVRELQGSADKSLQKRLARLRLAQKNSERFPLGDYDLSELRKYLHGQGAQDHEHRLTFELTLAWLDLAENPDHAKVVEALELKGLFSDFQLYEFLNKREQE